MKARRPRLEKLLEQAERHFPVYLERTRELPHESKGIRRSEMFFLYASVADSQPTRVVESGRARAQSTLVLARLFPSALIVSLESDTSSPDVEVAKARLQAYLNVDCRFGNSITLLPEIVRAGDIVLIDGPKDLRAVKLALRLLQERQPSYIFVHDLWPGSAARNFVDRRLSSALLSDEPGWVRRYAKLDPRGRALPELDDRRRAYGPTLGRFELEGRSYNQILLQCRLAQGFDRLRATWSKVTQGRVKRPGDFQLVSNEESRW